jgi:hypothetical protein
MWPGLNRIWRAVEETLFTAAQGNGGEGVAPARRAGALAARCKTGAGKTAIVSALTGDSRASHRQRLPALHPRGALS